jgi:hypothetical protein
MNNLNNSNLTLKEDNLLSVRETIHHGKLHMKGIFFFKCFNCSNKQIGKCFFCLGCRDDICMNCLEHHTDCKSTVVSIKRTDHTVMKIKPDDEESSNEDEIENEFGCGDCYGLPEEDYCERCTACHIERVFQKEELKDRKKKEKEKEREIIKKYLSKKRNNDKKMLCNGCNIEKNKDFIEGKCIDCRKFEFQITCVSNRKKKRFDESDSICYEAVAGPFSCDICYTRTDGLRFRCSGCIEFIKTREEYMKRKYSLN